MKRGTIHSCLLASVILAAWTPNVGADQPSGAVGVAPAANDEASTPSVPPPVDEPRATTAPLPADGDATAGTAGTAAVDDAGSEAPAPAEGSSGSTSILLRTRIPGSVIYVSGAEPEGVSADTFPYPGAPPCETPCWVTFPNGEYTLEVGHMRFDTVADGVPQAWDIEPMDYWARNLAIAMDVIGGVMLIVDMMVYALYGAFDTTGHGTRSTAERRAEIVPEVAGVGVVAGLLLLGSIPLYVDYSSSGSATQVSVDDLIEVGSGVRVTPGAALVPGSRGLPSFALTLTGTWEFGPRTSRSGRLRETRP